MNYKNTILIIGFLVLNRFVSAQTSQYPSAEDLRQRLTLVTNKVLNDFESLKGSKTKRAPSLYERNIYSGKEHLVAGDQPIAKDSIGFSYPNRYEINLVNTSDEVSAASSFQQWFQLIKSAMTGYSVYPLGNTEAFFFGTGSRPASLYLARRKTETGWRVYLEIARSTINDDQYIAESRGKTYQASGDPEKRKLLDEVYKKEVKAANHTNGASYIDSLLKSTMGTASSGQSAKSGSVIDDLLKPGKPASGNAFCEKLAGITQASAQNFTPLFGSKQPDLGGIKIYTPTVRLLPEANCSIREMPYVGTSYFCEILSPDLNSLQLTFTKLDTELSKCLSGASRTVVSSQEVSSFERDDFIQATRFKMLGSTAGDSNANHRGIKYKVSLNLKKFLGQYVLTLEVE